MDSYIGLVSFPSLMCNTKLQFLLGPGAYARLHMPRRMLAGPQFELDKRVSPLSPNSGSIYTLHKAALDTDNSSVVTMPIFGLVTHICPKLNNSFAV